MLSFSFKHVCIESYALHLPTYEVSSREIEDKFAPLYEKLNVPFGTLERLSGIKSRHFFGEDEAPSQIATKAAEMALERIGFDRSNLRALFNCSVTRDYFEPATAVLVHSNLGFPEDTITMDITNACIGFSHGMMMMANLIESGVLKAGVVVTGENISRITSASLKLMLSNGDINRDELLKLMPTFTLGSGAVAMVLAHDSIATSGHRIVGAVSRAASEHHKLCIGNGDFFFNQTLGLNPIMHTDSHPLMAAAAKLGGRAWQDASELLGWSTDDIDHIFCHQVGRQVNENFYRTMGLPMEKEYTVYETYGNMISAAMPSALVTAAEEQRMKQGEKILLTAFGSGLNAMFTGLVW